MRVKSRWPSESALKTATRSAQIVSPYVAFSTLQPVITAPSAVSSAAPTLNCEKVATACSRARRARSTSASELTNDPLQERNELSPDPPRRLHHVGVIERLRQDAGRHVRDARNPEHLDPHVP